MPSPQKLDTQKALKQKLKGMSYQDIAEAQGVAKQTVHQAIAPLLKQLPELQELAEMKRTMADHFAVTAYRSLAAITDEKLSNSSARDLGILAGVSIDKQRLIDGQSTSNNAVWLQAALNSFSGNNDAEIDVVDNSVDKL